MLIVWELQIAVDALEKSFQKVTILIKTPEKKEKLLKKVQFDRIQRQITFVIHVKSQHTRIESV